MGKGIEMGIAFKGSPDIITSQREGRERLTSCRANSRHFERYCSYSRSRGWVWAGHRNGYEAAPRHCSYSTVAYKRTLTFSVSGSAGDGWRWL